MFPWPSAAQAGDIVTAIARHAAVTADDFINAPWFKANSGAVITMPIATG
jgi:hypothetical protein